MPERTVGEIFIKIAGDASSWYKTIANAQKAIAKFVLEAKKAKLDLSEMSWEEILNLKGLEGGLGKAQEKMVESLSVVRQELVDQGEALTINQKGIARFTAETVESESRLLEFSKSIKGVSRQLWLLTKGLEQIGKAFTAAFTIPLAGIATAGIKVVADWEEGQKRLQATAHITAEEVENLTKQIREMALVMPESVKELQAVAIAVAEVGISTKNLERWTIAVAKTVKVFGDLSPEKIAEIFVGISKTFGIAEENVERVGSLLRRVATETGADMTDLGIAMLRTGDSIELTNLGLVELATLLGIITPITSTATTTGRQFAAMVSTMYKNLDAMASQMGISKEALKGMISDDLIETLFTYVNGLKAVGDEETINAAMLEIFGEVGKKTLLNLTDAQEEYRKELEKNQEVYKNGILLTEDYLITTNTLISQFKIFKNAILEVSKVIGDDLVEPVRKALQVVIKFTVTLASLWLALPNSVKKVIIQFSLFLAVLGPVVLVITAIFKVVGGVVTILSSLVGVMINVKNLVVLLGPIFASWGSALAGLAAGGVTVLVTALGEFILIAGAVVLAAILIAKALKAIWGLLDDLFNISEKIKNALGITDFAERMKAATSKINGELGELNTALKDFISNADGATEAASGLAASMAKWGDEIMERFLYGFRDADFSILDDAMRIVESYFSNLEAAGQASADNVLANTLQARRELAKAIYEVKLLGSVTARTRQQLERLVGSARVDSILKELTAALRVEELQEGINKLTDDIKYRRKQLKKETDVIEKAIKEREDGYDSQIESEEEILGVLQKRKKEMERRHRVALKAAEDEVEILEEERDLWKDRLDTLKESNELFIDGLEEQKDILQDSVDDSKDALDDLKDLRKKEVDTAEGMLDFARMNLEAARNQLKKEKVLGRDEFDVSFRAAKDRTDVAQDQVDLAYAAYLRTKNLYKKDENILEDQLKADKEILEIKNDEIALARRTAKAEEKILEERLNIATSSLDDAKQALDDFKDIQKEESEILEDEIDVHKDRLDDLKDSRDEIIKTLREEKDALNEKYDKEIEILDGRLEAAEGSLESVKKAYDLEKNLNEQRLKLEQARNKAIADAVTEYGGIAADKGVTPEEPAGPAGKSPLACYIDDVADAKVAVKEFEESAKPIMGTSLLDVWKESLNEFLNTDWGGKLDEWAKRTFKPALNTISTWVNDISTKWRGLKESVSNSVDNLVRNVVYKLYEMRNQANDALWSMIHWVEDRLYNISNKFYDMRNRINDALWSMIHWVTDRFNDMVNWIRGPIDSIKNLIDRISPYFHTSPSLVEQVDKGLEEIKKMYGQMEGVKNINLGESALGPVSNTRTVAGVQGAIQGVAQSGGAEQAPAQVINFNPGMMMATQGEIREFARVLKPYLEMEESRRGMSAGGE